MKTKSRATRWLAMAMLLGLGAALPARSANALLVFAVGEHTSWLIVCNDGTAFQFPWQLNYDQVFLTGVALCSNHFGVANITNTNVLSALQTIQTCDPTSSVTVARDLGGGNYEALTAADLAARLAQSQGQPHELAGYRVVSVIVGGIELHPNPVGNLPTISMSHIFSDEFDTGQFVGGRTIAPTCAAAVPLPPSAVPLLGFVLATLGASVLAWRTPARSRA